MEENFIFLKTVSTYLVYWVRKNVDRIVYLFILKERLNFPIRVSKHPVAKLLLSIY